MRANKGSTEEERIGEIYGSSESASVLSVSISVPRGPISRESAAAIIVIIAIIITSGELHTKPPNSLSPEGRSHAVRLSRRGKTVQPTRARISVSPLSAAAPNLQFLPCGLAAQGLHRYRDIPSITLGRNKH